MKYRQNDYRKKWQINLNLSDPKKKSFKSKQYFFSFFALIVYVIIFHSSHATRFWISDCWEENENLVMALLITLMREK